MRRDDDTGAVEQPDPIQAGELYQRVSSEAVRCERAPEFAFVDQLAADTRRPHQTGTFENFAVSEVRFNDTGCHA